MRHTFVRRVQRILSLISFAALLGIFAIVANIFGYTPSWPSALTSAGARQRTQPNVALISGHAGSDSGAVCTAADGTVTLTEAETVAHVAELTAKRLRRAGVEVVILEEFDPLLEDLHADILLSLHADSCIAASGYKAAYYDFSLIPVTSARILGCIDERYAAVTGLPQDPNRVTIDMTAYHAFRRIAQDTPAAILEMGFLGGDQALLTERAETVAQGVAESLLCFLEVQKQEQELQQEQEKKQAQNPAQTAAASP